MDKFAIFCYFLQKWYIFNKFMLLYLRKKQYLCSGF